MHSHFIYIMQFFGSFRYILSLASIDISKTVEAMYLVISMGKLLTPFLFVIYDRLGSTK